MTAALRCPACHGATRFWRRKQESDLFTCLECGTVSTNAACPADYYAEQYPPPSDAATAPDVAASLASLVAGFDDSRRTNRWLDIGFGTGALLRVVAARRWEVYGTEADGRAIAWARAQGFTATGTAAEFPAAAFDVVTAIEVLEHLEDPEAVIAECARVLRPGGTLYLTTPNALSASRRLLGEGWSIFSPPEHLVVWSPRGLQRALGRHGLRTTALKSVNINPGEILARFRRSSGPVDRNELATVWRAATNRSAPRRVLKGIVNAGLSALRLGDTLKVTARKP